MRIASTMTRSVLVAVACSGLIISIAPGSAFAASPAAPGSVVPVGVTGGEVTSGINVALQAGAAVSGTVTIRHGSTITPFRGGRVVTVPTGQGKPANGSAVTAADGSFTITGLSAAENPDGVYVCVYPDDYFAHPPRWYGGCSGSGDSWGGGLPIGKPVALHDGQVTTGARILLVSRPRPGWGEISVKVKGADGTTGRVPRIVAFDVNTREDVDPYRNQGDPDWHLIAGDYRICAIGRSGRAKTGYVPACVGNVVWFQPSSSASGQVLRYPKKAKTVHVAENKITHVTITEPVAATIQGAVRETRTPHAVVPGAVVRLWRGRRLMQQGSGRFRFRGLAAGRYTLCAGGSWTIPGSGTCWKTGTWSPSPIAPRRRATLRLRPGHRYVTPLRLHGGFGYGAITGRVTGAQGRPLPGVDITAFGPDGTAATVSGHSGTFRFAKLVAFRGTGYRIYFDPSGLRHFPHVPVFYRNSQSMTYADVIRIRSGRTTSDVTQALSNGVGSISGIVTGDGGVPLPGVDVTVRWVRADGTSAARLATTRTDGTYVVPRLRATMPAYTVCFDPSAVAGQPPTGYAPTCYDGAP